MNSGALFYQKCSEISTLLDSEQAEYAVNWSPRVDLFQVSGPRGGGGVRPPRPPPWLRAGTVVYRTPGRLGWSETQNILHKLL